MTALPLSIDAPGDNKNIPVENRFEDALNRERFEVKEGERMDETLSEPEEDMGIGGHPS